jgi:hypothetical protein
MSLVNVGQSILADEEPSASIDREIKVLAKVDPAILMPKMFDPQTAI